MLRKIIPVAMSATFLAACSTDPYTGEQKISNTAVGATAGALLGTKTMLNEFIAYLDLAHLPEATLSLRSRMIMTYALCGFANFGSLGIMIGGLATMCPERRDDVVSLGLKSIVSGTLSTCILGAIVGLLGG